MDLYFTLSLQNVKCLLVLMLIKIFFYTKLIKNIAFFLILARTCCCCCLDRTRALPNQTPLPFICIAPIVRKHHIGEQNNKKKHKHITIMFLRYSDCLIDLLHRALITLSMD